GVGEELNLGAAAGALGANPDAQNVRGLPAIIRAAAQHQVARAAEVVGVGRLVDVEPLCPVPPDEGGEGELPPVSPLVAVHRELEIVQVLVIAGAEVGVGAGLEDAERQRAGGFGPGLGAVPLEADAPLLREPAEVEEAVVLLGTGVLPPAILPVVAAAGVIAPLPTAERAGHRAVGAEGLVVAAGQLDLAMGGAAAGIGDEVDRATERVPAQQRG